VGTNDVRENSSQQPDFRTAFFDADHRYWEARALFNKGGTLGALGRVEDEIAVYDDVLARFGNGDRVAATP
jgi:hypothetical protein